MTGSIMRSAHFHSLLLTLIAGLLWSAACPVAHADEADKIQSALIVSFAKLVSWPDGIQPKTLGIMGNNDLGKPLEDLARLQGLTVVKVGSAAEASKCQILYIGKSESGALGTISAGIPRGVLTVGTSSNFADDGGMIKVSITDGKPSLQINKSAAAKGGLTISSRLAALASK